MRIAAVQIDKPKYGAKCNGCGVCCTIEPCELAQDLIGCSEGPCIALEIEAGRTFCGLVRRPAFYMFNEYKSEAETGAVSVMFANMLGIGRGCDASDGPVIEARLK